MTVRRAFLALVLVAMLGLVGCPKLRGPTAEEAAHDGSLGASIGALLAGPAGASIGAGIAVVVGVVVRSLEKGKIRTRHAEEKTALTQVFAAQLQGMANATARTQVANAPTSIYHASEALTKNREQEI